jgi:hypothetical protein
MSRRGMNWILTVLAALALALPVAARNDKDSKNVKTSMDLLNPATIAGKDLKPGNYTISADDNKVTFSRDGKVVAEAPVQWRDEAGKSRFSAIVTDGDAHQIKEIHFNGKTRFLQVSDTMMSGK